MTNRRIVEDELEAVRQSLLQSWFGAYVCIFLQPSKNFFGTTYSTQQRPTSDAPTKFMMDGTISEKDALVRMN